MQLQRGIRRMILLGSIVSLMVIRSGAATKSVGDIADRFVVQNYLVPEEPIDLYNYSGSILVIDFWAYWCGPCKDSTPLLESEVRQYYLDRGGNPAGIPVEVISISLDNDNLSSVQNFIDTYHPEVVGLANGQAWSQFNLGYIPHFAVINCAQADSHDQWEIVYSMYGFNLSNIRAAIDSVTLPPPYEQWRRDKFSSVEISDPDICGDYCDPDGDGLVNLHEYAFRLHPTQFNSEGRPVPGIQDDYLTITYRQNKDATDVSFTPQVNDSLTNGNWVASGLVETTRSDSNTYWSVTVSDSQPVQQADKRFMRLKLDRQ